MKIITDLLAKNPVDSQSKILQETISGIMNRLKDLEKKPVFEIDDVISPKINEPFHLQQEFEQVILSIYRKYLSLIEVCSKKQLKIISYQPRINICSKKWRDWREKLRYFNRINLT